jgi:signal peptidase I
MEYIYRGDTVLYKNKRYIIIHDDFDCGGNFHLLDMVRIPYRHTSFARVIQVEEAMVNKI